MDEAQYQVALDALIAAGWRRGHDNVDAFKAYNTARGPQDAKAYLYGPIGDQLILEFYYSSAGRNVTEPVIVGIPLDAGPDEVREIVRGAAESADQLIQRSRPLHPTRMLDYPGGAL